MTPLALAVAVEQPTSSLNPVLNGVVTFLALAGLLLEWRSLFNDPGMQGARR